MQTMAMATKERNAELSKNFMIGSKGFCCDKGRLFCGGAALKTGHSS